MFQRESAKRLRNETTPVWEIGALEKSKENASFEEEVSCESDNDSQCSTKTFETFGLHPQLLQRVYDMGFRTPSKIQEIALPILLANPPQNVIVESQPGTGKTAASALTMLHRVDTRKKYPQALYLSPNNELAVQTGHVTNRMSKFCVEIGVKLAIKEEDMPPITKVTEHIIIGTPDKVMVLAIKHNLFDLRKIAILILDEADTLLATLNHLDLCMKIHNNLSDTCQTLFFSCTFDKAVISVAERIAINPVTIKVRDNLPITEFYKCCGGPNEKYDALRNILGTLNVGQTIVHCVSYATVIWLLQKLNVDGQNALILSDDLSMEQRLNVLDTFRCGKEKVLIATNSWPKGIHFPRVRIVVNFDFPAREVDKDQVTYLRRLGSAGSFGKKGIAFNLID